MTYIEPFRISANVFKDDRGTFSPVEINEKTLRDFNILQVNTVETLYPYIFRGLHWQEPPYAQSKLIRCTHGRIIDFVVDIRSGSPYFGRSYAFTLSDKNDWVFVPRGFAHGYITLEHDDSLPTTVEYLVDNVYNKESEGGMFMTKEIFECISRELPKGEEIRANERDMSWPKIDEIKTDFVFDPEEQ